MKHEDEMSELADALGLTLDEERLASLAVFERLLVDRAVPLGLVSGADRAHVGVRHVGDSLRAAASVPSGSLADLGSGGGLPGIVLAIARPDVSVSLVEPKRRRMAFLELAVESLGLPNATPVWARAEDLSGTFDAATARALADPVRSWSLAERVLRPAGRLVYFAGARFRREDVDLPGIAVDLVSPPPLLASSGPLVIMSRQ